MIDQKKNKGPMNARPIYPMSEIQENLASTTAVPLYHSSIIESLRENRDLLVEACAANGFKATRAMMKNNNDREQKDRQQQ